MSGQTSRSRVHKARPPSTSHSSFLRSGRKGTRRMVSVSGERKENVLQTSGGQRGSRAKLVERAGATEPAVGEQDETVGNPFRVRQLVNGQNEGAPVRGNLTDQSHDFPGLPQVEAIEWLIHEQERLGREQRKRQHQA